MAIGFPAPGIGNAAPGFPVRGPLGNFGVYNATNPTGAEAIPGLAGLNFNTAMLAGGSADSGGGMQPAGLNSSANNPMANAGSYDFSNDPSAHTANSTADNPSAPSYQGAGTVTPVDPTYNSIQAILDAINNNKLPSLLDYEQNIRDQYGQALGGLDTASANANQLTQQNSGSLNNIYTGLYNSAIKDQGISNQSRADEASGAQDLQNRQVAQAQQAGQAQNQEMTDMLSRLGMGSQTNGNNAQPSIQNIIPVTAEQQATNTALEQGGTNQANIKAQQLNDQARTQTQGNAANSEGAAQQAQLNRSNFAYQTAVGSKRADLQAQEAKDLTDAKSQAYQAALSRASLLMQLYQYQQNLGVDQYKALYPRGAGYDAQGMANANKANAQAMATSTGGNTNSALDIAGQYGKSQGWSDPEVALARQLYATSIAKGNTNNPGTAPTITDIFNNAQKSDPNAYNQFIQGGGSDPTLLQFLKLNNGSTGSLVNGSVGFNPQDIIDALQYYGQ